MIEHILRKVRRVLYLFAYFPLYILCKIFFRLNVQGKENLPRSKQLLIVARHDSYWDPPLIGVAVGPGYTVHFIARKSLLNNPLLALPVKIFTTTISRDNFGKADLRKMLTALKEEETICILPEGTTRETRRPKRGAVKLAERTGKAFLPVNISSPHYPP
ncbi:MAG: lysophospholipid acyltransferase family protein, partial [Candidatus Bipolaricaulota bacterium]